MHYPSRIRNRAAMKNGNELLEIASREEVRLEMRRRVAMGEKPVTALSEPMIESFGENAARNDNLRRLAGEVTAYIVETEDKCGVRASGSRKIMGDRVFTSGQPFRLSPVVKREVVATATLDPDVDVGEVLVRFLSDDTLALLEHAVVAERERREGA